MKILIVAATHEEINPLLLWLEHFPDQHKNLHADVLTTGIGMVNTALQMGNIFAWEEYDLAINAGIAGSFRKEISIGQVVNIISDCYADFGVMNKNRFQTFFETGFLKENDFPFTKGKLIPVKPKLKSKISRLIKANGITVNIVSGETNAIKKLKTKFKADVESMEGAAFFQACIQQNVPSIQIRSISNYVEERSKQNWNIPLAISQLNKTLIEFLIWLNHERN